jgi:hypothetical protein
LDGVEKQTSGEVVGTLVGGGGDAGKKISYEFGGSWFHVLGDILHS